MVAIVRSAEPQKRVTTTFEYVKNAFKRLQVYFYYFILKDKWFEMFSRFIWSKMFGMGTIACIGS